MKKLKKLMTALMAFVLLTGCEETPTYEYLRTNSGSVSTVTCSGGDLEEPYNLGGTSIMEFFTAANMIQKVIIVGEDEIPEDTGYEALIYTRQTHFTFKIAPPYIGINDDWYRIDDEESLYYLEIMNGIIKRKNILG